MLSCVSKVVLNIPYLHKVEEYCRHFSFFAPEFTDKNFPSLPGFLYEREFVFLAEPSEVPISISYARSEMLRLQFLRATAKDIVGLAFCRDTSDEIAALFTDFSACIALTKPWHDSYLRGYMPALCFSRRPELRLLRMDKLAPVNALFLAVANSVQLL